MKKIYSNNIAFHTTAVEINVDIAKIVSNPFSFEAIKLREETRRIKKEQKIKWSFC